MKTIIISYNNGKFETYKGKNIKIKPLPTEMVAIVNEDEIVFVANINCLRYLKFKT
tara:strand:- start:90 stop:257 length:168 start_codon:yes stop_codon:yes gene_type:complete